MSELLDGTLPRFASETSARQFRLQSLRHRLPLLIFGVLATTGAVLGWIAHRQVEQALRVSGLTRATDAANQVADLLAQSAASRIAEARRLASDADVRELLAARGPTGADPPRAITALLSRNRQLTVSLYDASAQLLRTFPAKHAGDPTFAIASGRPSSAISPLELQGDRVWYHTSAPVLSDQGGPPIGHVLIGRSLSSSGAPELIERLMGHGAGIKLGNASGDVWTDLSSPVAPPHGLWMHGPAPFTAEGGQRRLGATAAVEGTPWIAWVDISESDTLAPARTLVSRMVPFTLLVTLLAVLAVYAVSARVTTPLEQLAAAADAIAGGDYSRRVAVDRRDEIGRLAAAYNMMASRVAEAHETLESRVAARTQELEHAREEIDQFFSLSLDLLCIADTQGRFRRVNPAWEQVLGWTASDLTSAPYVDFVHPDDVPSTSREAASLCEGGSTLSFENRYRCKDGSYRWLSWKAAPVPGRDLIYAAAHDVTEEKQAAHALQRHANALENANRELEAFSYSVSHDLRAPLRSIDGFAQALVEDYWDRLDDGGRDFLSRIRAAAQRMGVLIDDLLSLARVTRAELTYTDVDLSELVESIATQLQHQDPARRVDWHVQPHMRTRGDARLLRVALENLVANAWKFTSRLPLARIEFRADIDADGQRVYEVRDNGAGFDMAFAGKLFGAFQRLHGDGQFPGTGVGLATVQRIVHRHGGRVWANAKPGAGASFFFTLQEHARL